ncbi:PREDICTED: dehydrodolichyl diphosphate synthase 2-like isoform X2 [Populus euphratica]|uniref:Alkyl transferase n=1 Tax=Populus euphratica TaxID=75702 RepID=A0AAJ6XUV5_POPEU|nr:PREDICTED: dehydrodolichyl diphosphate synthase 2-like isoform X2 [Populus euphratica]
MQSLNLPIPIYNNNLAPQKADKHSLFRNTRDQTHRFPTSLLAAKHDLVPKEEEDKGVASVPLPEGLLREAMPRHVAVIMDGNARWARQRGFIAASAGHEAGARSLRELVELCCDWGIGVLTVFAFSYDNWIRPKEEVDFLMSLFERLLVSELDNLVRQGARVSTIGDSSRLSESLKKLISDLEEKTKDNSRLHLIVAVGYSGKYDVTKACKSIAQKVKDGTVQLEDIDESLLEQELETNCTEYPCPDLLIRTSGELRISNFLLWQLAYTELFFAEALWPDFGKAEFIEALTSYQQRQRRYGGRRS